ncbi:MAG TPA: DUF6677 family protein [Acidobacteriaceae bacterium]|nr:DUF6677 family protein [Acidobacteriaceae bacterium]
MRATKLVYSLEMSTAKAIAKDSAGQPPADSHRYAAGIVLIAGWMVPGLGHLMQGKWIRAALLFVSIICMFSLGLAMHGKIYSANSGELLEMLGFVGDLGNGILYLLSSFFGWGQNVVQVVTADYGTKFIVVAGLLNFISAVDAHSLRLGRKN